MRKLMLERIQQLRERFSDFSPRIMRWQYINYKETHISRVDFTLLKDEDLLELYEKIVRQCSKMM